MVDRQAAPWHQQPRRWRYGSVALGILCTNYGRCYVHLNLWCTIVDVEPNLLTCISIVTTRCQRQDGDEVQNSRLPHVFCLHRPPSDFRLPDGVTPPRQNAPHRFCAPLASSRPRILQPNCRRWKWWCWGSRRHNEMIMFGSWGRCWCRKLARVCKYRQDATQAGVYIIFNNVKKNSWLHKTDHYI